MPETMNDKDVTKRTMTPIEIALPALMNDLSLINEEESLPLLSATGRVLAENLTASIDVPPYDNSAMDGYAINSADLAADKMSLEVAQRIPAGEVGSKLGAGQAARIFTGAPIPVGADAVVMQENCEKLENAVHILQAVKPGANIRQAGEDIKAGSTLLSSGHRLVTQDVGILASVGLTAVKVKRKLKIALMTTGNELVQPGTKLAPGQIYNSNFFSIAALLQNLGAQIFDVGVVADDLESTQKALQEAASNADCIISTGGVSVGEEDYVKAAVENLGQLKLWKLAIKPGKPLACGEIANTPFFGLPGNPVSAFVTFCLVVRPCLLTMLGCNAVEPKQYCVVAAFDFPATGVRQEYLRVSLSRNEQGETAASPYSNQSSGVNSSLSGADGLAIIPPHTPVSMGDKLVFVPFSELIN